MTLDDPWFARQQAERAWRRYAEVGATEGVRAEVGRSWERSAVHLAPDRVEAPLVAEDRARERWQHSPVRTAVAALREELDRVVGDGGFIAAVTGADGTILWTHGSAWMRDRAARVHFVPGGCWDEASIGTNALDLALRTNAASQVFSAEHYSAAIHDWVCYSAPIQDLRSGRVLGVLDLSTSWERAQPLGLTAAKLLASNLSLLLPPTAASTEAVEGLDLRVLGHPEVRVHGRPVELPRRQIELLTVLTLHPEGMNLQALHAALHPDHTVQPATVKSEVSHLRRALGHDVLASRPYRLMVPVRADHLDVMEDIAAGRLSRAVSTYAGPLLAGTEAPALRDHANYLEAALRRAVLMSADADLLFALGARLPDEVEVHERTLAALPDRDPRAGIAHARLTAALV
jgi:hypothetical protein